MLCKECLQKGIRVSLKTRDNSKLECPKCKRIVDLKSAEIVRLVEGEGRRGIPTKTSIGMPKALARERPAIRPSEYPHIISKQKFYVYKKPREWGYVTKPFFAKIKEPLVDVFKEAQEVQLIIDLGGFAKGEVNFGLKNGKYTVYGKHGEQEFKEEIDLPKGVDLGHVAESFKNNILGIILPRKTEPMVKKRPRKIKKPKRKK